MTRVPSLGSHGQGWVVIQLVVLAAIAGAGLTGPAWSGDARLLSTGVGLILLAGGLFLAIRGAVNLRDALTPLPRPRPAATLVTIGPYRFIRHPIYVGVVVAAVGWGLLTAAPLALLGGAALLVVFDLKSRVEEAWLVAHDPEYATYRERTRRFVPGIY
jgi:protein-S-isoprenylcysteine O-methyltransferase Ste14